MTGSTPMNEDKAREAFEDSRVQAVYGLLCDETPPPKGEHWEGFVARRIVAALATPPTREEGPGYNTGHLDLDDLLTAAYWMHQPGANMDNGMEFMGALKKVQQRLDKACNEATQPTQAEAPSEREAYRVEKCIRTGYRGGKRHDGWNVLRGDKLVFWSKWKEQATEKAAELESQHAAT